MPDPKALLTAGLVTRQGNCPIPLEGVSIEAEIRDFCSRVTVSQRFRNAEAQPIEAVYVFPLDEGAAVCAFEAVIGGTRVVGRVQEKEAAFAAYDDAIAAGHGAYLLDQERPDVFTASIGNLRPGDEVLVRVTYVAELAREGDAIRFALPTTVSPRYAPAEDIKGVGRTPAMALNPPVAWTVPYGLELRAVIEMASAVRSVESPSHPVSVEIDGSRAVVSLAARQAAMDRDFVLKIGLAEPHAPRTYVETTPGGDVAALIAFEPRFESSATASEIVFLVDRSGSMGGSSIGEARNALQLCLRSLREGCLFNVVGFGSRFEALFSKSRPYDDHSLAEASRHVAKLDADMGGTEILPALQSVLGSSKKKGLPRQLFILTDGQVTNTEAAIALVREHAGETRVFTFGIGAGASAHLVRGLARAGEGEAEFVHPGERIEGKVLRQLKRALAPALSDVEIDWGGLKVRQAPHRPAVVFDGGRVLVYGFVDKPRATKVTLRARGPEGLVSFTTDLDPAASRPGTLLATLAARALIRDLEEGQSPLHDRRGSLQERGAGSDNRVKAEIVALGVTYGLCSRETSFVAVEERETPLEGDAVLRRVPVALTSGWGGLMEDRLVAGRLAGPLEGATAIMGWGGMGSVGWPDGVPGTPLMKLPVGAAGGGGVPRPVARSPRLLGKSLVGRLRDLAGIGKDDVPGAQEGQRPLDRLVALQRADGSWDLTQELARLVGQPLSALEQVLARAGGDTPEARRAWATALALRWLELLADLRSEWEMLADKAASWLTSRTVQPAGGGSWSALARSTLG